MQVETTEQAIRKQSKIPATYRRGLILSVLFFIPAFLAFRPAAIIDPDIYWHVRTGQWILEHREVPRIDPFTAQHAPWIAYSWLFELMASIPARLWGLRGILSVAIGTATLIALSVWFLIRRLQPDFLKSTLLAAVAFFALSPLFTPRPWAFSICVFAFQLQVILRYRKDSDPRSLIWLPLLYALNANIHIQFIFSLMVLGLAAAVASAEVAFSSRVSATFATPERARNTLWLAFLCSLAATLINPYGWGIYRIIAEFANSGVLMRYIDEMRAMPFREPSSFIVLALALLAAYNLARRRSPDIYLIVLLAISCYLSFRSIRDSWVVVLTSCAIIASTPSSKAAVVQRYSLVLIGGALIAAFLLLLIVPRPKDMSRSLAEIQASSLPVNAVKFIRSQKLKGPMLNHFDWGGFLIGNLPEIPVQIDGRGNVHTFDEIERSARTWNLAQGWRSDPDLSRANLIVGPRQSPLSEYLVSDPRFKLVYHDDVAYVFIRR